MLANWSFCCVIFGLDRNLIRGLFGSVGKFWYGSMVFFFKVKILLEPTGKNLGNKD